MVAAVAEVSVTVAVAAHRQQGVAHAHMLMPLLRSSDAVERMEGAEEASMVEVEEEAAAAAKEQEEVERRWSPL